MAAQKGNENWEWDSPVCPLPTERLCAWLHAGAVSSDRAQVPASCDLPEMTGTFAQLRSYSLHSAECPRGFWPSTLKEG